MNALPTPRRLLLAVAALALLGGAVASAAAAHRPHSATGAMRILCLEGGEVNAGGRSIKAPRICFPFPG